jgi:hypothetical protein
MTTAEGRRIAQLTEELDRERIARRLAEQWLSGMRSAVVRLQAQLAQSRADTAKVKAEHVGEL